IRRTSPEDLAAVPVEAEHVPDVLAGVVHGFDVTVVADPNFRVGLAAADRRGDEHAVPPDDRAGVPEARNRSLPANALASRRLPDDRRVLTVRDAGAVRPAKRRPVQGGGD